MDSSGVIRTNGLTKQYGSFVALSALSLEIRQGEVFGLLGPNGSGKTTTMRLLLGMLGPRRVEATVMGFDCWRQGVEVRRLVSYLPGELRMSGSMSGFGLLSILSELREGDGLERAVAIADQVMRLDLRRRVRKYSTGMKQKLALAHGVRRSGGHPDPGRTDLGPRPVGPGLVLDLVREAKQQGQTVIFSGHVLAEVEARLRSGGDPSQGPAHARRGHARAPTAADAPAPFPGEAPDVSRRAGADASGTQGLDAVCWSTGAGRPLARLAGRDAGRGRRDRHRGPAQPVQPVSTDPTPSRRGAGP